MVKPMSRKGVLACVTVALVAVFLSPPRAWGQGAAATQAGYHNQQGIEHFKRGFYEHAPRNEAAEAERNYAIAVEEFRAAISLDPFSTDAHRNLARVAYVRKEFDTAAAEYQRVTELAPDDLDAYVNLALALVELKRLDETVHTLENAKAHTSDPQALRTLDTYIARVRDLQGRGVR